MQQAMSYVLTLPVRTLIIGIKTIAELEENVRIAQSFKPLTGEEMTKLEGLTKPCYAEATFFKRQRGYCCPPLATLCPGSLPAPLPSRRSSSSVALSTLRRTELSRR